MLVTKYSSETVCCTGEVTSLQAKTEGKPRVHSESLFISVYLINWIYNCIDNWCYIAEIRLKKYTSILRGSHFNLNLFSRRSPIQVELESGLVLSFVEGEEPENSKKNSRSKRRTNNNLDPEIEPGAGWWEASALITLPPLILY